jgi:regulator of sigma E protease
MTSIFDLFQLVFSNIWLYGGTFLLVLSILVFVHEWGHYIVARLFGVKVEVFSIGFGKEIFGFNDSHGTRWKFSMIPLGGYVKMFGDTDPASTGHSETVGEGQTARPLNEDERKVAFFAKPVGQRALIVFAGPAVNFIFAIILLTGLFTFHGQPVTPPVGAAIVAESAADKAGFEPHDRILEIDGRKITSFDDIRQAVAIALDTPMDVTVKRGDEILDITVTPDKEVFEDRFGFQHSRGVLGLIGAVHGFELKNVTQVQGVDIASEQEAIDTLRPLMDKEITITMKGLDATDEGKTLIVRPFSDLNTDFGKPQEEGKGPVLLISESLGDEIIKYAPLPALGHAIKETKDVTVGTLTALGQMITGTRSAKELGGLIRIGAIAGDMAQAGLVAIIMFTALLSINLGLINLFPIPVLDGGHLVFYAVEAVKGSPIPEKGQEYAFRVGFTLLIGLMVFANLSDILQLIL